jgi:hypothetical protein
MVYKDYLLMYDSLLLSYLLETTAIYSVNFNPPIHFLTLLIVEHCIEFKYIIEFSLKKKL